MAGLASLGCGFSGSLIRSGAGTVAEPIDFEETAGLSVDGDSAGRPP
ncbi:hypothetical protein ACIA5D_29390 [Actinoplanes sp. NPDC051513]